MYLGKVQLGEYLPLSITCRNASRQAANPDAAPLAKVFTGATRVANYTMAASDLAMQPGRFALDLFIGAPYSTGDYQVYMYWTNAGFRGFEEAHFEVIGGGHANGAVCSISCWERPEATYVLQFLDSGIIIQGRNPQLARDEGVF